MSVMAYHFNDNIYTKSFTPKEYQVELLDAARERNIIVCLGSASGKLFIATKLIQELSNSVRRSINYGGKRTIYLADNVDLVAQKASYIRHLTDLEVGEYCDPDKRVDWIDEINSKQVLVMLTNICCHLIACNFLSISDVSLIIVDDCHNTTKNHYIRQIMLEVTKCNKQPRIIGLTSPLFNSNSDPGRLEGEIRRLEIILNCTAETASDIVSVLRYCSKPKELVVECAEPSSGALDITLESIIIDALNFINDHRYDPSELYDEEFEEELKNIPDPKIDPSKIFQDFLYILHTMGAWCADKAALALLLAVEKLKVKTPYERHYLLLCMVSTVLVKVRSVCDEYFKIYDDIKKIYEFSSPKVLRLVEILYQFKPVKGTEHKTNCFVSQNNKADVTSIPFNSNVMNNKKAACIFPDIHLIPSAVLVNCSSSKDLLLPPIFSGAQHMPVIDALKCCIHSKFHQNGHSLIIDEKIECICEQCSIPIYNCSFLEKISTSTFFNNLHCRCLAGISHKIINSATILYQMNGWTKHYSLDDLYKLSTLHNCVNFLSILEFPMLINNEDKDNYCLPNEFIQRKEACDSSTIVTQAPIARNRILKNLRKKDDDSKGPSCRSAAFSDDADNLCGLIFVADKFTAKILYYFLNDLRKLDENFSFLTPLYTVDKTSDPLTDPREAENEHRKQEDVLKRFRMRDCNILVSTSVLEEGIDIPKCNLVIGFDAPSIYRSYAQSKGRARAQDAHYIVMVQENSTQKFIKELAQYFEIEQMLLRKCANQEPSEKEEIIADELNDLIEAYAPVNSPNKVSVNMATAVALVNRYCAKLPSDTFTRLTPLCCMREVFINEVKHYTCSIRLPINSPVKQEIVGLPMPNRVVARRIAALEVCRILHQARELDDNLMPVGKERFRIHEEEEAVFGLDELEELVFRDSSQPRPGTTKRRQYYYKRIADALTDCRPVVGDPSFLYHLNMTLTCPLPEEQNTRGRKIYPPEDSMQGFGILTLKKIPKICPFPIFTRSGEVSVKLELSEPLVVLTEDKLDMIITFLNYTFTSVLRLQKYLMMFDPKASENSYFIVPTRKRNKDSHAEVDWEFLQRIYENCDLRPHPVPQDDRVNFTFDATRYHDAVIMPWYRNQDQPQYFYVAEICNHLNPKSSFPGTEYKTFDEYYFKKYNIQIQNNKQPLLDVDHTSARLNFLTPRYVNRKGVALPTSSEETKRAKRENLEQKQILVPELCTVHPFPASLWRKAVCLPCILYRINALLLADQIRCQVAHSIALGQEQLAEDFEWAPLNFGWSLADVLKKSRESNKIAENKQQQRSNERNSTTNQNFLEIDEVNDQKKRSANEILSEEEQKIGSDWMEIGTWSNDMANHQPSTEFPDVDEFDPNIALPSNLTLLGTDSELANIQPGCSDWGTGIEAQRKGFVRYGSPTSWLSVGGLEPDLSFYESDDSCSENGLDLEQADVSNNQGSIRIEFKSENVAEAVEDIEQSNTTSSNHSYEIPWKWDDSEIDRISQHHLDLFNSAANANEKFIECSSILVRKDKPLCITRKANQPQTILPNIAAEVHIPKSDYNNSIYKALPPCPFIAGIKVIFHSSNYIMANNTFLDAALNATNVNYNSEVNSAFIEDNDLSVSSEIEDLDIKFSFDTQPCLEGHPGPSPSIILQALTMSNANDGINLERLETIGDSFLKYAITAYLYCTYDNIHEGKLSHLRSKQVSNLNLYRLGRRKGFGESMIATKFEPHDNWLPPCYYVPRELEQALIEAGIPASLWNQADLPALRQLNREEICQLVQERSEHLSSLQGDPENVEEMPCFIPYNLITQHSIPDKSVADCVEALIGAYLIACGPRGALLFMAWLGICVLPKEEYIHFNDNEERPVGSLYHCQDTTGSQKKQVKYISLQAPRSPLLRNIPNPEVELERLLDGYEHFEQQIGYRFRDRSYLLQSLTHASYSVNRLTDCYQRLEFLGDAVLDYLITRHLYEDSRQHSPGALTDLRSALVNNTIFASLAVRYSFHKYFRHFSPGLNEVVDRFVRIQEENGHTISEEYYLIEEEECEEAEDVEVPKALGDVFESVAGAIFLDSNMSLDAVWKVYYRMMKSEIEQFSTNVPKSPIRELLELEPETAKFGKPEKLADGRRVRVTVEVFGKGTYKGIGRNYRIAKCTAAKCALKQLKKKGLLSKRS